MEREVRYCTTDDGVRIAYCVEGEGPPLVWCAEPQSSHLALERSLRWAEMAADLTPWFSLVRFDARGLGLSDRSVEDLSLEARVVDIEAVVATLGLEDFVVIGGALNGAVAVRYAAKHPEKVSRLVLYDSVIRMADFLATPQAQAVAGLLQHDWEMFSENLGTVIYGWEGEEARRFGAYFRKATTPDQVGRYLAAMATDDGTPYLADLTMPVLVIHHTQLAYIGIDRMRGLTASLPDGRLVLFDGRYLDHWGEMVDAILQHCGMQPPSAKDAAHLTGAPVRAVLFTDLVGHTEMMSRLGDERGRDVLREHERITRDVLKANGGTEVKTMGDGFMASFGSVTKAVECAVALQRAFADHEGESLNVRVGLNAGEPIEEDGDLFGATVILASRIAAKAEGGEILVADTVRGLCSGKGILFSDRGEFVAKGFEEPVRVYEVKWSG